MNSILTLLDESSSLAKQIKKKTDEIEKRKELIEKMADSEIVQQKTEFKENKIDSKISQQQSTLDSKRQYYQNEIKLAQDKCDKEMRDAQEKLEKYRMYCHQQMELLEQKFDTSIKALEQQKDTSILSVSDDKILKRLEIEIRQLEEQKRIKDLMYEKESKEFASAKKREMLEQYALEEEKQRQEDYRKRELALQEASIKKAVEDREREQKRQEREEEIQSIMKSRNCSHEKAFDIWRSPKVSEDVKEKQDVNAQMKQIRIQYPEHKLIWSELDGEYKKRVVRMNEEELIAFIATMTPLLQAKLKIESEVTFLDDIHEELYESLSLDLQFQCIKLKDKAKRYKFLDKYKKTRVDEINESFDCVQRIGQRELNTTMSHSCIQWGIQRIKKHLQLAQRQQESSWEHTSPWPWP